MFMEMTPREVIKLITTPYKYTLDELEDIPIISPELEGEHPLCGEESLDTTPLGWPEEMDEENTQAYLMEDFGMQDRRCRNG